MNNNIDNYIQFIRVLTNHVNEHFEDQKEYIKCAKGCAHCCKNAEYPCSELEFEFVKLGFSTLNPDIQQKIISNIDNIKKEKANFSGEKFRYTCPFLINDACSIYNFRMIICRTFGLAYYIENEQTGEISRKAPFCMELGLNYGDVYDKETMTFSKDKFEKLGYKKEPVAYNTSTAVLREKFGKEVLDLEFGEEKSLIDWL